MYEGGKITSFPQTFTSRTQQNFTKKVRKKINISFIVPSLNHYIFVKGKRFLSGQKYLDDIF